MSFYNCQLIIICNQTHSSQKTKYFELIIFKTETTQIIRGIDAQKWTILKIPWTRAPALIRYKTREHLWEEQMVDSVWKGWEIKLWYFRRKCFFLWESKYKASRFGPNADVHSVRHPKPFPMINRKKLTTIPGLRKILG